MILRKKTKVIAASALALLIALAALFSGADADALSVKVSYSRTLTLPLGATASVHLTLTPNVSIPVSYKSGNAKIAAVDKQGNVTGLRAGTTTITTRVGKKSLSTAVKVLPVATSMSPTATATVKPSPTATPTPTVLPAAILAPSPVVVNKTIDVPGDFLSVGDELKLINAKRAKARLRPLKLCNELYGAAQTRAYESSILFEHTRPDGTSALALIRKIMPTCIYAGENIAMAKGTEKSADAAYIMELWMDSPGHRANILRARFTHVAMAAYRTPNGGVYWTQLFIGM